MIGWLKFKVETAPSFHLASLTAEETERLCQALRTLGEEQRDPIYLDTATRLEEKLSGDEDAEFIVRVDNGSILEALDVLAERESESFGSHFSRLQGLLRERQQSSA